MEKELKTEAEFAETLSMQMREVMRTNTNQTQNDNCADSTTTHMRTPINGEEEVRKSKDHPKVPEINIVGSTHADKIMAVPCRQIPGSPEMSPVTRRRRTALAKKAMELEKAGKITRLRVVGSNSVILEFRDKSDDDSDGDLNLGSQACADRRGSRDDSSLLWKRYKSPRSERRRTVPPMKLGLLAPQSNLDVADSHQ